MAGRIRLAVMNWRRGLLLAGIHLVIVVPAFAWEVAQFWRYTGTDISSGLGARVESVVFQEEMTIPFDPCKWFDIGSPRLKEVGALANLPTALLTGWHGPCLTQTPLGVVVRRVIGGRNHLAEIADCVILSALVLTQWILVGGLPLVRRKHWWFEPGAFITAAAVVGTAVSVVPTIDTMWRIPAFIAGLGWLWWLGLLLWIPLHHTWKSTLGRQRRLTH
jgi:hypothetical protein